MAINIQLCNFWYYILISFKTCKETTDASAIQKAEDFVRAFTLGFEVDVSDILAHCNKNIFSCKYVKNNLILKFIEIFL